MSNEALFAGRGEPLGGLSNEDELVGLCPEEFMHGNSDWSDYAMRLFYSGGNIGNWKWKSDDKEVRNHQFSCFNGLLGSFGIKHEHKEAIAGWMLSEMLTEVPEYIPKEEKEAS